MEQREPPEHQDLWEPQELPGPTELRVRQEQPARPEPMGYWELQEQPALQGPPEPQGIPELQARQVLQEIRHVVHVLRR